MKIAAIIDEFSNHSLDYTQIIKHIRHETQADYVIAAMSGDFLQQGLPAPKSKYARAALAITAGVDLIIEIPVYASLQSPDTFAFAAVALLERLECVDELAIICHTDRIDLIQKTAMFLFMEPMSFQSSIRTLRSNGIDFYEARAIAMEKHIPGTKDILNVSANTFATEYGRAMKRMYSTMKPRYISVKNDHLQPSKQLSYDVEKKLTSYFKQAFSLPPNRLNDTFGGTSMLTDNIYNKKDSCPDFLTLAQSLSTATRSESNIRRYLLSLMLGIRKQDIAISRLYSFSVYARIIGCSSHAQPLMDCILEKAWMPVFIDKDDVYESETLPIPEYILNNPRYVIAPQDASKQMLLKLDHKAHEFYQKITDHN